MFYYFPVLLILVPYCSQGRSGRYGHFGKLAFYSGRGSQKVIVSLLAPCLLMKFPWQRSVSHQPAGDFSFPSQKFGKSNVSCAFQSSWFVRYDATKKLVFCHTLYVYCCHEEWEDEPRWNMKDYSCIFLSGRLGN